MALVLTDFTTNGNTLTNNNAATESGNLPFSVNNLSAVNLVAASSQSLSATDSASLSQTGNMTIEFWVNFATTPSSGNFMALVDKWQNGSNQRSYLVWLYNDSGTLKVQAQIDNLGDGTKSKGVRWPLTPTTSTWYHLAVTITPANNSTSCFELFINGSTQGAGTSFDSSGDGTSSIFNGSNDLYLGGPSSFLNGILDDVRIWSAVRTGTQINTNKSVRLTGTESNLVAYWPFDQASSSGLDLTSKSW